MGGLHRSSRCLTSIGVFISCVRSQGRLPMEPGEPPPLTPLHSPWAYPWAALPQPLGWALRQRIQPFFQCSCAGLPCLLGAFEEILIQRIKCLGERLPPKGMKFIQCFLQSGPALQRVQVVVEQRPRFYVPVRLYRRYHDFPFSHHAKNGVRWAGHTLSHLRCYSALLESQSAVVPLLDGVEFFLGEGGECCLGPGGMNPLRRLCQYSLGRCLRNFHLAACGLTRSCKRLLPAGPARSPRPPPRPRHGSEPCCTPAPQSH